MKGDPTKTQRLLDLLAFLATRRAPVGVGAIVRNVAGYGGDGGGADGSPSDAVLRKFERDKAELRDLGVPLESETVTVWGGGEEVRYRLRADSFFLPVLRLLEASAEDVDPADIGEAPGPTTPAGRELQVRPDELAAAVEALHYVHELPAFPLRRAARSALAKLTFDLAPDALEHAPGVLHLSSFDRVAVGEALSLASEAMARRKTLHFEYFSIGRNHRSRRSAHPLGLLYQGSRWYLVAQDPEYHEIRMFRVDRMERVELEERRPRTPDFETPEGFSLDSYRGRRPWELDGEEEEVTVTVYFRPPLSLLAARNGWGAPREVDEEAAGEQRGPGQREEGVGEGHHGSRVFQVRTVDPFLRWLLTHHRMAEIVSPATIRERLDELRIRTLEVHR